MCKVCSATNGRGETAVGPPRGWKASNQADDISLPQAMTSKDLKTNTEEHEYVSSLPPFSPPKKAAGPLSEEENFELITKWQAGGLTLDAPKTSAVADVTVKYKSREDLDAIGFDGAEEEDELHDLYALMDDDEQAYQYLEDDFAALAPAMEGHHHFFFYEGEEYGQDLPDEVGTAEAGVEETWDLYDEFPTALYPYTKENGGVWYTTEEDGYHPKNEETDDTDNSASTQLQPPVRSGYLSAGLSLEQSSRGDSTQVSDNIYIPKGWEKFPREIARQKFDLKKDPALPSLKQPSVVKEEPAEHRRVSLERVEEQLVSLAEEIMQAEGLPSSHRRHRRTSRDYHRPRILDLRRRRRNDSGPIPGSVRMPSLRDKLEEYERALEGHPRRSEPPSRRSSLTTTYTGRDVLSVSCSQSQWETGTEDASGVRFKRSSHHHRSRHHHHDSSAATTPRPSRPSSGRPHRHRHGKNKDNSQWKIMAIAGCVIALGVIIWGVYGQGNSKITATKME